MTIRGTCDSCGKHYRLPAVGHAYTCKACGGTVLADEELELVPVEEIDAVPAPEKDAHPHHGSVLEHRAAIDARHKKDARRRTLLLGAVLVVFAGAALAYEFLNPEPALAAGGVARDLATATSELERAWSAGDVEALVLAFHPHAREAFRKRIERVAQNRGWTGGSFEAASGTGASVTEGTEDQPTKAEVRLASGAEKLQVKFSLQFEPLHDRWYAYHVDIPPPPLATTLASFDAAWKRSSPEALAELFPPDSVTKLTELVERKTRALGWDESFPELGAGTTTGEQELRRATEPVPGLRVETAYAVPEGELRLRWQYRSEPDTWYLASLTFPKKE